MENKKIEEINKSGMQAEVIFRCNSEDLREFITNLLGKPQTISKTFRGAFDITSDDIKDLYHLIIQRIYQQNKAFLIQFTARIVFDDNSSVLLNSLDDFMAYREVRPISSNQLHLTWSFFVEFLDRQAPEKQDIEISFVASGGSVVSYDEEIPFLISTKIYSGGFINFRIRHTARTWGADIEALLSGHIKNMLAPPSKLRKFAWKHSLKIGLGVAIIFFMVAILFSFLTASFLWNSQQNEISQLFGNSIQTDLKTDLKIDFILKTISSAIWAKYYYSVIVFLVLSFILSILFGIWAGYAADTYKPSFIVLTEQAKRNKEKQLKKYSRKLKSFILSIVIGVGTGIVSNYLFQYLWTSR